MAKRSPSINLLKTSKNETISQVVNWLLTVGRVLIIVVELVALSAFLYRFVLDNQLRDINNKINQEQAVISAQKKNEETYRNLQDRLSIISNYGKEGSKNVKVFKEIIGFAPLGMTFSNVTLSETAVKVEANVSSVFPLSTFINSLKNYSEVESISIDKIENKTASAYISVSISIGLKKTGGVNEANTVR